MTRSGSNRLLYWVLGAGLLLSYAYFYQGGGWNQNSRFALVRAMTERDTLQIDAYREAIARSGTATSTRTRRRARRSCRSFRSTSCEP